MIESWHQTGHEPFRVEQLHEKDRYELSDGHPIYCTPGRRDHAYQSLTGSLVLATDPVAEWSGIDAGYQSDTGTLRAPDIAVGPKPEKDGWIPGAPPLAVEYAGRGQDEAELQDRIADLLAAGTRYVWVVRLVGPRRVEVYAKDEPLRVYGADDTLQAPGILRNPVRVQALYERETAHEAVLTNLLQRRGYDSLEAVRAESEASGEARALLTVLEARGVAVSEAEREAILNCRNLEQLRIWLQRAVIVETAAALFK